MGVGKNESWEYLNGATLFKKWAELGSLSKVREWMIREGITNPATGESPTNAGIRVAVRRWMAENPSPARSLMREIGEDWVDNDEEWWTWLIQQARGALGNRAYQEFIHKNDIGQYERVSA